MRSSRNRPELKASYDTHFASVVRNSVLVCKVLRRLVPRYWHGGFEMRKLASLAARTTIAAALVCMAGVHGAKADTLVCGMDCTVNTTSVTWTGIVVTGGDGSYAPTTSTDSITLWFGGSGEAVAINNCTANCGTTPDTTNPDESNAAYATLFGGSFAINSSLQTTLAAPTTVQCADNGFECNFYDYTLSTVCWGNSCLVPGNGTIRDLTLLSLGSGEFVLQGNSIQLSFSLPEVSAVAEPSSLLMLGSGLLGVLGLGLFRKRSKAGFQA